MPLLEAIHRDGQEFDVIPTLQFAHAIGEVRRDPRDTIAKRVESAIPNGVKAALLDDHRALVILDAIDRDEDAAGDDVAERLTRIAGPLRQPEPKRVDRRADV